MVRIFQFKTIALSFSILCLIGLSINTIVAQDEEDLGPSVTTALAVSPDGTRIAVGHSPSQCLPFDGSSSQRAEAAIRILNAQTGEELAQVVGPICPINDLAWSSDGTQLAISQDVFSEPWTYNFDTHEFHSSRSGGTGGPVSSGVEWNNSDQYILNFSNDLPTVSIFDSTSFDLITRMRENDTDRVTAIALSSNNYLAVADLGSSTEIWNLQQISSPQLIITHNFPTNALAWNPTGDKLALGINDIQIINPFDGTVQTTLHGHTDVVVDIKWSPDGQLLATGGLDNTIRIWDPIFGREIAQYPVTTQYPLLDWSPNSTKFIYAVENTNSLISIVDAPPIRPVSTPTHAQ